MSDDVAMRSFMEGLRRAIEFRPTVYPDLKKMVDDVQVMLIGSTNTAPALSDFLALERNPEGAKMDIVVRYCSLLYAKVEVRPTAMFKTKEMKKPKLTAQRREKQWKMMNPEMARAYLAGEVKLKSLSIWLIDKDDKIHECRITSDYATMFRETIAPLMDAITVECEKMAVL